MASSTVSSSFLLVIPLAICLMAGSPSWADRPVIGIGPLQHRIPHVGQGISRIISSEVAAGSFYSVLPEEQTNLLLKEAAVEPGDYLALTKKQKRRLSGQLDYLLTGEVAAFEIADKDTKLDLGGEFADLQALLGGGSEVAHVVLNLVLYDVREGDAEFRLTAEGLESQHGVRVKDVTYGWAATVDFESDEFRETQLGIATYKAVGDLLLELYGRLPLSGAVLGVFQDSLVIDWGEDTGVRVGDEVTIFRAREITNEAGETVWFDEVAIGRVEVLEFQADRCLCLILDGEGQIEEGDLARPAVMRYPLPLEAD